MKFNFELKNGNTVLKSVILEAESIKECRYTIMESFGYKGSEVHHIDVKPYINGHKIITYYLTDNNRIECIYKK